LFDIKNAVSNKVIDTKFTASKEEWYLVVSDKKDSKFHYIFISKTPSAWMSAKDSKWRILNDKYFIKSSVQFNEAYTPMVELTFNDEWAKIFWELSTRLVWQQMAIFVWWELLTAPNINEPILWGKAVITWNYKPEEAKTLSQDINTWVVPAPIYLTSEKTIDSRLWASSLDKMIVAWFSWFVLILLFLLIVYRLAGFISAIALFIYIMLVLSIVKSLWIVLTLASIAWLILSIGMAIDSNILIFERVKEELRLWKTIEDATIIWFKNSWSAIWDSHVTWLIVSWILFVFGINMIKWFWLMLAIWIVVSLFSAMWISRILLMIFAKKMKSNNKFIWVKNK
jgi:preprotein translocase subunit SecD